MKKDNGEPISESVHKKLIKLRQDLETSGQWPESANKLWLDLVRNPATDNEQDDETMFSIVVSDAINGVDITERYPEFYRRMLQNPEIFQLFLEAVEVLEADAAGLLEPLPEVESSIPQKLLGVAQPILERLTSGAWLARWQQSVEELNTIFSNFSPIPAPGYRSGWDILEESAAPLIRSEITVEDRNLGVLLTAVWADDPDALRLQLTVAIMTGGSADFSLSSLTAGLYWGDYSHVSPINQYGQAAFPPLPIESITDETGQTIKSDLKLLLHPTA